MIKNLSLKTQYYIGAAIILMVCCVGASWYQYKNLQNQALASVYQKTEIYLMSAASIRSYVKDVLRPKIRELLTSDQFILEAMSTSYISRQIMNNLKGNFLEFSYKRAAIDPRNLVNKADQFEQGMLRRFYQNSHEKQWGGLIKKEGRSYYARMMPIFAEQQCLTCHGDPDHAPEELRALYGTEHSFGFKVGDIVGADTIYIPMDNIYLKIKEKTAWVFLFGVISLSSLFALFAILFNRTVIQQLKKLLSTFRSIYTTDQQDPQYFGSNRDDEIDQIKYAFENVADDLRLAHEELKASETKYRTLFEASPDVIFVANANGQITDLNHAGADLFEIGNLTEYLVNAHFFGFFADTDKGRTLFSTLKSNILVANADCILKTNRGKQLDGLISANRLLDEQGEFVGIEGVIRDVTEEKKLRKQMAQTERLASIGQLAAGVAHEINNPLGVILCYGDLIKKSREANQQIIEDTDIIQKHAHSCKTIVESLLNFARVSEAKMIKSNLHECIDEILSVLQNRLKKQNIEVEQQFDSNTREIIMDEHKMEQVFMNLFLNSIQAMPAGGKLYITSHSDKINRQIIITVEDTGCGIPEDKLDRVFEPFFTTKGRSEGTGLGLSVTYGIIQQHHGEIQVSSQLGEGTRFSIYFPAPNN